MRKQATTHMHSHRRRHRSVPCPALRGEEGAPSALPLPPQLRLCTNLLLLAAYGQAPHARAHAPNSTRMRAYAHTTMSRPHSVCAHCSTTANVYSPQSAVPARPCARVVARSARSSSSSAAPRLRSCSMDPFAGALHVLSMFLVGATDVAAEDPAQPLRFP